MNSKNKEKIVIREIIKNVWYVVGFAMKTDKALVWKYWFASVLSGLVNALFNTLFLKRFIDILQDKSISLTYTVLYVLFIIGLLVASEIVHIVVQHSTEARLVNMTGKIQAELLHKTADIDLVCYDNKQYFDDFVLAASQSEDMITRGIISIGLILVNTVSVFTMSTLILTMNPMLALFPIVGFVFNIITRFYIEKYEYEYEVEKRRIMRKADYSKRVFYQPEYMKEVRLFDVGAVLEAQFDEAIEEASHLTKTKVPKICILSAMNWFVVFTFLSYWCVPCYLGYLALKKASIALGDVSALNNASTKVRNRLDQMNYALIEFQKIGLYADKFRRFVEYKIETETAKGNETISSHVGTLKFENVSFSYPGNDNMELKNISFEIKPGERVAIVGENGAGKTTLIKLILRLYDVTEGRVTYDGKDIREYTTKEYRTIFGTVFQDYQIYGLSLAENVLMDQYDETKRKKVVEALELSDFEKRLELLENNVETQMTKEFSDNGVLLSGGESQKVAIARLFAKGQKAKIAILDEPSSALDPYAEYILNRNILEHSMASSVIFISHRLSTTREADRIFFLDNGEIVEQGSHQELMKLNGRYAEMFRYQACYYQSKLRSYE